MSKLTFKDQNFELGQYESVLECLLRHGQAIPYACKAGMCQACLIRAVDCEASPESRKWIKPSLQALGYTLACQWVPDTDVKAELPGVEDFSVAVQISEISPLSASVMKLILTLPDPSSMFAYRPGQYLTLIHPDGFARSYSIANDYEIDQYLELHIGATSHGVFSNWIFNAASVGMTLHMRGPAGDCFYNIRDIDQESTPLLMAATGTGLAPLYGILRDALHQGHTGPVQIFHGGRSPERLYYVDTLKALAASHPNVQYYPCVREVAGAQDYYEGPLESIMEQQLNNAALPHTRVYLCGAPAFVHGMRKKIFLKGAKSANIYCDPFTERNVPTT